MVTLHDDEYTFLVISGLVLLRMKNISGKICRETRNTRFVFRKLCLLWDNVEKYCRAEQTTDDNMAHGHCMLDT